MLPSCSITDLKIFKKTERTRHLSRELSCSELAALVLETGSGYGYGDLREWIRPDFEKQIEQLNLGQGSKAARELWTSNSTLGNVLVYGDYDTDGIASTVLAMEIFRNKAAQVRYFIPKRDVHGYGLNAEVLSKVASLGTNTLVVTDCGTNDSRMLEDLKRSGIKIFVFDHHALSEAVTIPTIINPTRELDKTGQKEQSPDQKLCATGVLWCWAWKENVVSKDWLR